MVRISQCARRDDDRHNNSFKLNVEFEFYTKRKKALTGDVFRA